MNALTPPPDRQGYVALILHAHLPYMRHPEDPHALELRWLYDGITECYLPLLEVLEHLGADGVPFVLTLSVSPTLLNMLADPLLRRRYEAHLDALIELADREVARTAGDGEIHAVAQMYQHLLRRRRRQWRRLGGDLTGALRDLAGAGRIELLTCAATHGFLPLLAVRPEAVRAQVAVAVAEFRRFFGHPPAGFWLPECGYYPGLETVLAAEGVRYVVLETHGLTGARPAPSAGAYAPVWIGDGVAALGRDPETSRQVWSAREGYPGDYAYREYYRDVGFDLDLEYVRPYVHPDGHRVATGIKYFRITGPTDHKAIYDPGAAHQTAVRHAGHFVWCRERQVEYLAARLHRPPLIVAPYDAELFGHWWFEGPVWLEHVARRAACEQSVWGFTTPGAYLAAHPPVERVEPPLSSWGYGGYCDFWLSGPNHWVWRHLHHTSARMAELVRRHARAPRDALLHRALRQAGREVLLAQASDWPFILRSGTQVEYARRRLHLHLGRFTRLYEDLTAGRRPDPDWLRQVEEEDACFPDLDPAVFA
ncbi:glycoside hydrolase family 57 protein [Caldinitratiruptor microaerophilus]|uniref:Glycoside hydrolase family protein n=1 Tax=Caldinitratiruptor microaerophilus TaxID=671077 RepID=A0AA35CPA0_9FIRM|nr:1,4-alpha-glucan branching protein domain-containing protein [Caldinitratiruptor microaerophilus]BDG62278.1 glycoside hydrolase family protein [Caldinitratiruptor microaerophilus]